MAPRTLLDTSSVKMFTSGLNMLILKFQKAFLNILHSIDRNLVNEQLVEKSSNLENLEMAFDIAEEHFQIPRFLDAADIDVEKPDEKSIMMYVAEIIKVAEARAEQSSAVTGSGNISPEMAKLDNLLLWTSGAEEALKKKHKLRKYTPADYKDYADFQAALTSKKRIMEEIAPACDPEQIRMMEKVFEQIERSTNRWLDGLDKNLPKKYQKVSDALKEAQGELKGFSDWTNREPLDDLSTIEMKVKGHEAAFSDFYKTVENFQKLKKSSSKDGISEEQLAGIAKRLAETENAANARLAWLKFNQSRLKLLSHLAVAQTKLNIWTEPFVDIESVEGNLNDWLHFMEMQNFADKLLAVADEMETNSEAFISAIPPPTVEEQNLATNLAKTKCSEARLIVTEMNAVKDLLTDADSHWNNFLRLQKRLAVSHLKLKAVFNLMLTRWCYQPISLEICLNDHYLMYKRIKSNA